MKIHDFYARQEYLTLLKKRIDGFRDGYRQNIAIIGDEQVGKTSIIHKFISDYSDNHIILLYIEARPETLSSFVKRFSGVLLYNFLLNSGIPLKEDLNFLLEKSEKFIPKTVEAIKALVNAAEKRKKNNIFTELFSLTDIIHKETGKFCVIIIDEFLNLEKAGLKGLYREWSKLLITQKNTLYIIISSLKFKTKLTLSKNLSLLFGNFELLTLEPFDIRTSESYIRHKLGSVHLPAGLINFMVHFTGGIPIYLEVIANELLNQSNSSLSEILEDLIFDSTGILNQRFSNYLKRFLDYARSEEYVSILYYISNGRNKIKDIAHILKRPIKNITLSINQLLEFDIITRSGDFLKINDRVFAFWLKFVYQEKMHSLSFNAYSQKIKFLDNIESLIQNFIFSSQKPVIERFSELLRLFEDETIQIERKKIKLQHFREIKYLEFRGGGLKSGLIGRSNEGLWVIGIKQGNLTEDDVEEFSKECKRFRNKLQRKIIVTLNDIDSNAKLRALEEKVMMWDLANVNEIFDVFSQPRVIA